MIADLRELDARTGGPGGARRVAWTEEWRVARGFLAERLAALPVDRARDAAGNDWAVLPGAVPETVVVGSHLDSVPGGGWLDGALGVFAGLEVLRACVAGDGLPARTVALVDWADEEGARFGRSVLGSSAFAGTLDVESAGSLRDADGVSFAEAAAVDGVDVAAMGGAGEGRDALAAYLELHIEQGPILEAEGLACAAVTGTFGVERFRVTVTGRAGHAGSTPMGRRADAGVAAARFVVALQGIAREHGGVCTAGRVELSPGIVTAVAGSAEVLVDQRHLDPGALAAMHAAALHALSAAAAEEGCSADVEPVWRIAPVRFDERLVALAEKACAERTGVRRRLPSGALHDAAELASVCPAAMVFAPSIGGVSHSSREDTAEADLAEAIEAFGALALTVIEATD